MNCLFKNECVCSGSCRKGESSSRGSRIFLEGEGGVGALTAIKRGLLQACFTDSLYNRTKFPPLDPPMEKMEKQWYRTL